MSNLCLRLHAHALLRESRIFPGVELCDETPCCSCNSFADIWKGDYRGELVCVKVIRARDRTSLVELKKVRDHLVLPETYSVHSISDIPSSEGGGRARSSSQRTPRHPGFGNTVSTLYHESLDAERKYHPVHPNEPGCRFPGAGMCLLA